MKRAPFDVMKRIALWLASGIVMISGYGLTKLEPYGSPEMLPLTAWDQAIPFLPWTIWIYGTATWAALIAWLQVPDKIAGRRLFFSVALAACTCWIFFAFFPTTYPRGLYPLPEVGPDTSWLQAITITEFADLRGTDSPTNCLPSQHVALAWALGLTWASFLVRPWAKALPILWAIAVSVCTLTTKQHYIIDVPTGFAIGVFAFAVCRYGITEATPNWWEKRFQPFRPVRDLDVRTIANLRRRVEEHQWSLGMIRFEGPLPPLDPLMVRMISQVIYIEEIAGLNFALLRDASTNEDLRRCYELYAIEERRHADGLRQLLDIHGADVEPPGLGNALILDQFDDLDPRSDADVALVACATPVFETFLDAGTIPFLQTHASIQSPAFDDFVERVTRDEGAHIATNWLMTRQMARQYSGWRGLRLLLNPNIIRGASAVPAMAADVYTLAWRLDYDFTTLLPAFSKLWRQHRRYPELAWFPLWWCFRLFVIGGAIAVYTVLALQWIGLTLKPLWTWYTRLTDTLAIIVFGPGLLEKRQIPAVDPAVRRHVQRDWLRLLRPAQQPGADTVSQG